jgi:hypothetical protein
MWSQTSPVRTGGMEYSVREESRLFVPAAEKKKLSRVPHGKR